MTGWGVFGAFLAALAVAIEPAAAQSNLPLCGFGIWNIGDTCRMKDGRTCKVVSYPVAGGFQTKCTKLKGTKQSVSQSTKASPTSGRKALRRISAKANLPASMDRVVVSGIRTKIAHFYALHPNCTSAGAVTVRIITPPQNGTLENIAEKGFPTYPSDNIRSKCNTRESALTAVWYKSVEGYTGRDQAEVQAIFPGGVYSDLKLQIDVLSNPNLNLASVTATPTEPQAPKPSTNGAKARVTTIPQTAERVVVSGARTKIWHFSSLQPDCKPSGPITVRVVSPPKHGSIESIAGRGFSEYPAANIRAKCNARESDITLIWYKSEEGFKGLDVATIEAIFPTGMYADVKLLIHVRDQHGAEVAKQAENPVIATSKDASSPKSSWSDAIAEGQQRILAGDILGARKALNKPADANNAEALLLLGETYDPNMLALWRVHSATADVHLARALYSRALSSGLELARIRLKALNQEKPGE